jgi:hypothetical protein
MSGPDNVVQLPVSIPTITHEQLAAADFEAWPDFSNFKGNPERARAFEDGLRDTLENLRVFSHIAAALVGFSKPDLIARAEGLDRQSEGLAEKLLEDLTRTREQAAILLKMISTAEARLDVAIANTFDGPTIGRA